MRVLLLTLALILSTIPVASAAEPYEVTVYARETDDCPEGKTYCFVMDGSLAGLTEGDEVTFTLINEGAVEHELVAGPIGMADPNHEVTDEDEALGEIPPIAVGASDSATFTVPEGGFYIFCGIEGHEALGMWEEIPAAPGESTGIPFPTTFALLGFLGVLLLMRRRS